MRDVLNGQSRSQIRLRRMKSTCGGGNRLLDESLLRREKEDGFDFIKGGSLGFHLNEVKISSWLDTISSESRKRELMAKTVNSLLFLSQVSHLFNKCTGLCPCPYFISPLRTSPISSQPFLSVCYPIRYPSRTSHLRRSSVHTLR